MSLWQVAGQRGVGPSVQGNEIILVNQVQGNVMYYNGTKWVVLANGTAGQLLTTQGADANPTWSAGAGKLILIEAGAFTGNQTESVSFTAVANNVYFVFTGHVTGAATATLQMQINTNTDGNYSSAKVIDGTSSSSSGNSKWTIRGSTGREGFIVAGTMGYGKDGVGAGDAIIMQCLSTPAGGSVMIMGGKYTGSGTKTNISSIELDALSGHTIEMNYAIYEVAQ